MLQKTVFLGLFFIFSLTAYAVYDEFTEADKTRVIRNCTSCHDINFLTPRSRKSWELTVFRMREMMPEHGMKKFSEYDAERIIAYLSHHFYEDSQASVFDFFKDFDYAKLLEDEVVESNADVAEVEEVVEAVVAEAEAVQQKTTNSELQAMEERFKLKEQVQQQFSLKVIKSARICGYGSVICLFVLIGTGMMRKKLKKSFKLIHKISALLLLIMLSIHTVSYILKHGTPPVLWYWFGMISLMFVIFAITMIYVKKGFGKSFVKVHAAAGVIALILGLLHWLAAYL